MTDAATVDRRRSVPFDRLSTDSNLFHELRLPAAKGGQSVEMGVVFVVLPLFATATLKTGRLWAT